MDVLEYFQLYHEEIERNRVLFDEAVALGQEERVRELSDELYELAFNHYQYMSEVRSAVQEMANQQKDPGVTKLLSNLEQTLRSCNQRSSRLLNELASEILNWPI